MMDSHQVNRESTGVFRVSLCRKYRIWLCAVGEGFGQRECPGCPHSDPGHGFGISLPLGTIGERENKADKEQQVMKEDRSSEGGRAWGSACFLEFFYPLRSKRMRYHRAGPTFGKSFPNTSCASNALGQDTSFWNVGQLPTHHRVEVSHN